MSVARKILPKNEAKPLSENMKQSLASLRLEGMTLSEEDIHDLQECEAGHISEKECLERALRRVKKSAP